MPGGRSRRSVLRRQREDVEAEFRCPICLETDKELRIFPICQHFVCTGCVDQLIATAQRGRGENRYRQGFDCPTCRAVIEVPVGGLPVHRLVENIRERHRRHAEQTDYSIDDHNAVLINEPPPRRPPQRMPPPPPAREIPGQRSQGRQREDVQAESRCPFCPETDKELLIIPVCEHWACSDCIDQLIATGCPNCISVFGVPVEEEANHPYDDPNAVLINDDPPQHMPPPRRMPRMQPRNPPHMPPTRARAVVNEDAANNNAVNAAEERRRQQVEQACTNLVENDDRCDGQCHKSCVDCGQEVITTAHLAFCEPGGEQCNNRPDRTFAEPKSIFLLPCWVYSMMCLSKPCIKVFRHEDLIRGEKNVYKPMRDEAWELMLSRQKMTIPYWFQVLWSVWLIVIFVACLGINIYDVVVLGNNLNDVMSYIACSLDGLCLLMWFVFFGLNLSCYKPGAPNEVKGYFYMQQEQQFLSELSVYPQLCISCLLIQTNYNTLSALPFYACSTTLLIVFALRFHTVVCIRHYIRIIYVRLLLFMVGSILVVFSWLVALTLCNGQSTTVQALLSAFIFSNNTINMTMFYISHLYEVTLQSGVTIMKLDPNQFHERQRQVTRLTRETQSFYKNMYPMGSACYGTLLFFWLFPVGAIMITCCISALFYSHLVSDELSSLLIVLGVASLVHSIVNAKTLLLSCSGYFTICVLLGLLFVCGMASAFFVFTIYAPIVFVGIIVCCCYICLSAVTE